jgi:membrane associated rhomboid family serine protease
MLIPIRDENPTRSFPLVTLSLILTNLAIFFYQFTLGSHALELFLAKYALFPSQITTGIAVTPLAIKPFFLSIFTSMFIHGGIIHIAGNMLYLWIFGNNIEDILGHAKFLLFYLTAGVGGAIAHIISSPYSQIPTIGASGAIAGILGAYLILFPYARVLTIVPIFFFIEIIRVPAVILIGFWFILQLFNGFFSLEVAQSAGGIAWFAHIGGFLTGLILIYLIPKRRTPSRRYFGI